MPDEPAILDKLVWPLRQAKGGYALGNYLGSIALCGMVGEMVAILRQRRALPPEELIQELIADVLRFCGSARPRDDMTLLVAERAAGA